MYGHQSTTKVIMLEFGEIQKFSRLAEQVGDSNYSKLYFHAKIKIRLYILMQY